MFDKAGPWTRPWLLPPTPVLLCGHPMGFADWTSANLFELLHNFKSTDPLFFFLGIVDPFVPPCGHPILKLLIALTTQWYPSVAGDTMGMGHLSHAHTHSFTAIPFSTSRLPRHARHLAAPGPDDRLPRGDGPPPAGLRARLLQRQRGRLHRHAHPRRGRRLQHEVGLSSAILRS